MSTATPIYGLRYPLGPDSVNVPGDMKNLADDVEGVVAAAAAVADNPRNLVSGETIIDRYAATAAITMTSGTMRLTYFTALKTETINTLRVSTGSTAAAATPTKVRYGIYTVAGNGDLTLVASTPNDTTLLAAANTQYAKALSASWAKVAGTRYAFGLLVVTAAATPTIVGDALVGPNANASEPPALCATLSGQTDLPSSATAASLSTTVNIINGAVLP